MTSPTTIADKLACARLAEQCEHAEGADRLLDMLIVAALCPDATIGEYIAGDGDDIVFHASALGIRDKSPCPRYTASLDAAMTLVPVGWTVANIGESDRKGWWAELRRGYRTSYDKVAIGRQFENATPALALCAAALRAIVADCEAMESKERLL